MALRVLVADSEPVLRAGIRGTLAEAGIEVVGEVGDGRQVGAEVAALLPDVLVLDPQMADFPGIGELGGLAAGVLVFTRLDRDGPVGAAVRAGVRGYLLKSSTAADLVRAVRTVAAGGAAFCPLVARQLPALLGGSDPAAPFPALTPREREVLALIATGQPNGAIADRLGLSGKTVSNHISVIFGKLQVRTRAEAIVYARENGLAVPAPRG
jgi:DNA-binding NarL/FixJ family response regulator